MKYEKISDIPEVLREALPEEAQEIYLEAYQDAWDNYEEYKGGELDRESVAHRNAMHAVQEEYVLHEDQGKWYPKGEEPEEEADEGLLDEIKDRLSPDQDQEIAGLG